jgi:hypothetical protein
MVDDDEGSEEPVEPEIPPATAQQRLVLARVRGSVKALAMHFLEVFLRPNDVFLRLSFS